jgi:hypothetical protein
MVPALYSPWLEVQCPCGIERRHRYNLSRFICYWWMFTSVILIERLEYAWPNTNECQGCIPEARFARTEWRLWFERKMGPRGSELRHRATAIVTEICRCFHLTDIVVCDNLLHVSQAHYCAPIVKLSIPFRLLRILARFLLLSIDFYKHPRFFLSLCP